MLTKDQLLENPTFAESLADSAADYYAGRRNDSFKNLLGIEANAEPFAFASSFAPFHLPYTYLITHES